MQSTGIRGNRLYFYGNAAGYVENGRAVVDAMFQNDELAAWLRDKGLAVEYRNGVYDRMTVNMHIGPAARDSPDLKTCRIWQLRPEVDPIIKFIGYDELTALTHGPPNPANYRLAYECELDTDDLDEIYDRFRDRQPPGFEGNPIALSDVIEIRGESDSEFHYIDKSDFVAVEFIQGGQTPGQKMHL